MAQPSGSSASLSRQSSVWRMACTHCDGVCGAATVSACGNEARSATSSSGAGADAGEDGASARCRRWCASQKRRSQLRQRRRSSALNSGASTMGAIRQSRHQINPAAAQNTQAQTTHAA